MTFAAGDQVRLPDGRSGSIIEKAGRGWLVAAPVELEHPERRTPVAAIEEVELADVEPWTEEMELELQAVERERAAREVEDAERRRIEQMIADSDFERKLRAR